MPRTFTVLSVPLARTYQAIDPSSAHCDSPEFEKTDRSDPKLPQNCLENSDSNSLAAICDAERALNATAPAPAHFSVSRTCLLCQVATASYAAVWATNRGVVTPYICWRGAGFIVEVILLDPLLHCESRRRIHGIPVSEVPRLNCSLVGYNCRESITYKKNVTVKYLLAVTF